MAEVALRCELFPDQPLAFLEPPGAAPDPTEWRALVAGLLPDAGDVKLVLCCGSTGFGSQAPAIRAAASVAEAIRASRERASLTGLAAQHHDAVLAAAAATLAGLDDRGWRWLVDQPFGLPAARLGGDAIADRSGGFDPLAAGAARP
jgi:hypothetical protein